ncbi:peptidyl-tRNA hydrolase ICT1, mitochondrial [Trichonephila clavata]|uniref:Large ribosomal subunit protein mL62 n=1 Tax=Trichonephila clavata TaxID=2740835 RepID=A0A8X6M216_TRICU|nr:peptidyl-tRNA hydrolase ICT1, mitochondrial [Trichonephila clavata]
MLLMKIIRPRTLNFRNFVAIRDFKSEYSLDRIYPNSSLDISKPKEVKSNPEKFSGLVPLDKLEITYSRSSGPGGQNVNKVNTKVEIRFHVDTASWIPQVTREKLAKLHYNKITKEGFMILRSDKTRLQTLNLADCMDKLRCYIREAEKPPPEVLPETLALRKKRQEKAAAERLREKRHSQEIRRMKNDGLNNFQI